MLFLFDHRKITLGGIRAAGLVCLLAAVAGCSDSGFHGFSKTRKDKTIPPPVDAAKFEHAVFAVRDLGCAMCHATVKSNIITDIMAGSDPLTEHQTLASWLYMFNDDREKDKKTTIHGNIIVPKSTIMHDGPVATVATETFDKGKCASDFKIKNFTMSPATAATGIKETMDRCAAPNFVWNSDSTKFEERDRVVIDPPTSVDDIKAIASSAKALMLHAGITLLPSYDPTTSDRNARPVAVQTGFKLADGAVKITGNATCDGALLIDAPVYFDNVTLSTAKGCRIYATASIFIKGKLEVVNTGQASPGTTAPDNANKGDMAVLMLMSPVFVGLHISMPNIKARLEHVFNAHKTFKAGTPAAILAKITTDAANAKYPEFTSDESDKAGAAIDYKRIVATAPVVYARMNGEFSGAIVAEHFMGKVGSLSFTFDPVLERAPFYPELILDVRNGKNIVSTGTVQGP